jgi:hypothetical protein
MNAFSFHLCILGYFAFKSTNTVKTVLPDIGIKMPGTFPKRIHKFAFLGGKFHKVETLE